MSVDLPNIPEDQGIDLSQISKKIGNVFQDFNIFLFRCIRFFVKNAVVILILVIIGFGLGMYLDKKNKVYKSEVIVTPNFESTDYLYSKINLLTAKVKEEDTIFLKSIGVLEPAKIIKISIEPIVDVYNFINNSERNFELLKLMAEDGDLKSIVKETATSKNYAFHTITIVTKGKTDTKKGLQPIVNYLNTSDFYRRIQKVSIENIQQKIKINEGIIGQIDGILNEFSNAASGKSQKSDKLVYYNENTQLNDVIKTKESLTREIGDLKVSLLLSDKIIKENSIVSNLENTASINGKMKFILPIILILFFIVIRIFMAFYKAQSLKSEHI